MPIIINGEVVPDNDPRAVARRNGVGRLQDVVQVVALARLVGPF